MKQDKNAFKWSAKAFLTRQGLGALRAYGRGVGVAEPTKKTKERLIDEIVAILLGELTPTMRSKRGAPVKEDFVDPKILASIADLKDQYGIEDEDVYHFAERLKEVQAHKNVFTVNDPNAEELEKYEGDRLYTGQIAYQNNDLFVYPLHDSALSHRLNIPFEIQQALQLQEGDVVTYAQVYQDNEYFVKGILTINGHPASTYQYTDFDRLEMCYPKEKMHFMAKEMPADHTEKCLEWLLPLGKGQRGLVVGAPKSGKSQLLIQMAQSAYKANKNLQVLAVLVGESLENIRIYQNAFKGEHLLYTSYDEDVEHQVEIAELALQRAKRMAENGQDVLLVVDSLQNLAHAFNDTDASEGGKLLIGNLESKTLFYCKKYFGTARCFTTKGSITMLCSFATETGNPADDVLKFELSNIANWEVKLSTALARLRVFPAIDFMESFCNQAQAFSTNEEEEVSCYLRQVYLPRSGMEALLTLLAQSADVNELYSYASEEVKNKN